MNTRVFTVVSSAAALALFAGCTVYKNTAACEDTMRSAAADRAASETLKISHAGAGIHGSRVVVEGAFESMVPASSVAAITAAWARPPASDAAEASGPSAAWQPSAVATRPGASATASAQRSTAGAAPRTSADVQPSTSTPTSAGMAGVLAPTFASSQEQTAAASQKPTSRASKKPVKLAIPAAIECRFDGQNLTSFKWLSPGRLVSHTDGDKAQSD
ncbi:hypothetical protein [Paraburkholderia sp. SOS3]|uniref:hypothetical protein n=1 Tax=Paraburkholderia sp. SOS3 TaxID=1926494 RepID=UPI0009475698|nr:hypothetical protein [Paraburkholderia sp. SOS3]APR35478.1 hypothetical protein BTO02_08660 [Paraburkholderia sp. SOS3]